MISQKQMHLVLDKEMLHHESWKIILKRSNVEVMRHKKQCRRGFWHSSEYWLLLVLLPPQAVLLNCLSNTSPSDYFSA